MLIPLWNMVLIQEYVAYMTYTHTIMSKQQLQLIAQSNMLLIQPSKQHLQVIAQSIRKKGISHNIAE